MNPEGTGAASAVDTERRTLGRTAAWLAKQVEIGLGTVDLSLPQYRILGMLDESSAVSSDLAHRLAVRPPTITAVVDGLVERHLVIREAVVGDRRSIRVSLTPTGIVALRAAEDEMCETLERIFEHAQSRDDLIGALLDLDDALALRMEARLRGERGHEVTT